MLVVVTALAFLSLGQGQTPPSDFAFRLEFGVCTTDVFDTFDDLFVRDLGRRTPAVSISLALPQESRDAIYRAIAAAEFFKYPSEFLAIPKSTCTQTRDALGGGGVCGSVSAFAPADHYKLTVRSNGVRHTVSWTDNIVGSTEDGTRLRQMLNVIVEMIRAMPDVQRLPVSQVPCA